MNHIYQIQVRGHLTDDWSDWFAGLRVIRLPSGETLLTGVLDQTGLHGVLARIRDLNLTLIAVNQVAEELKIERSEEEKNHDDPTA
jgi:hypothetical protein